MLATNLISLVLVLPTLALARHNSPFNGHSPSRRHHHARAAAFVLDHVSPASNEPLRRAYHDTIEHKMARKRAGKKFAKRGADGSQCRVKGQSYVPTGVSSTSAISSTAASSIASSPLPASTDAITSTSAWIASPASSASISTSDESAATTSAWIDNQQNWVDATSSSEQAAAASTSSSSSSSGSGTSVVSYAGLTPNGNKAGVSAGDSLPWLASKLGWWYDWSATPSGDCGSAVTVPMLWGGGSADGTDSARLVAFQALADTPSYIIGFEEPDCAAGSGSSGLDVATGIALWDSLIAPKGEAGTILVGPSMCKQAAESGWLGPFMEGVSRKPDIMNIHVNKKDAAGIQLDIDHYWNTYGLPIWVTEFACVDDSTGFIPCTDQDEINAFINTAVDIFETDSRIAGYAYSNGYGLSENWMMVKDGQLSESGQTYLAAISKYH
ncbi:hypothetical protein LQV05_000226 [Cryptococcus neoformans]|nr:hypothetical protein C356_00258 [Cryptococcus neoformans var. grubii c45]OXB39983.1 hypothetical protein J007_00254 [Cryptococcus neoformans var. grubii]OXC66420.1 hypothetical protein C358_00250 [Cryptococcus neoformans var. grubii MW-RSA852]UOH79231.1 hypothetical protein LQV05_000226 [Cryptococcus neoformans]